MDAAFQLLNDFQGVKKMLFRLVSVRLTFVSSLNSFHSVVCSESLKDSGPNPESLWILPYFFSDLFSHFEHVFCLFEFLEI
jgi:hypothetical protein